MAPRVLIPGLVLFCFFAVGTSHAQDKPATPPAAAETPAAPTEEDLAKQAAEGAEKAPAAETPATEADPGKPAAAAEAAEQIEPIKGLPPEFKIKDEWPLPPFDERKMRSQVTAILGSGQFNNPDEERLLQLWIEYQLARLTLESERGKLKFHKDTIIKQLRQTQPPNVASLKVHDRYIEILTEKIPPLFKNNFYVREAAAIILENLNVRDIELGNTDPNARATPYLPAVLLMLELVKDRKQMPAVKFPAIRGLVRAFEDPAVSPQTRFQIVRALLDELRRNDLPEPYQWKLITALGDLHYVEDGNNRPTVAQEFMRIIVDGTRSYRTRVIAAHNLSRIPLESGQGPLNLELVAIELVRLAKDMGDAYTIEPDLPHWKDSFARLYLSFHPGKTEQDKGEGFLAQTAQRPALGKYGPIVQDSYQQILPLVRKVVFDAENVDFDKQIEQMEKWLEEHPQKSDRISPNEDPILTSAANP